MASKILRAALDRLGQPQFYQKYWDYFQQEWLVALEDLQAAALNDNCWSQLQLPLRLKVEILYLLKRLNPSYKNHEILYNKEYDTYYYYDSNTGTSVWVDDVANLSLHGDGQSLYPVDGSGWVGEDAVNPVAGDNSYVWVSESVHDTVEEDKENVDESPNDEVDHTSSPYPDAFEVPYDQDEEVHNYNEQENYNEGGYFDESSGEEGPSSSSSPSFQGGYEEFSRASAPPEPVEHINPWVSPENNSVAFDSSLLLEIALAASPSSPTVPSPIPVAAPVIAQVDSNKFPLHIKPTNRQKPLLHRMNIFKHKKPPIPEEPKPPSPENEFDAAVQKLCEMGFSRTAAEYALEIAGGSLEEASAMLLETAEVSESLSQQK